MDARSAAQHAATKGTNLIWQCRLCDESKGNQRYFCSFDAVTTHLGLDHSANPGHP
ncbi:hypothetical protein M422DRAFT_272354 [Sphaerobolus stellatus SS14]|uniref:Uncharacterized protein n=1 Tax=Sphaerobolus stellatus (strain SS14) TaxID=990650 RepID=A0A0C9UMS1_SPHS4|nr:hypothetical protein M422DRAFT_272354 [Sphaerobolus stellatus SS14]